MFKTGTEIHRRGLLKASVGAIGGALFSSGLKADPKPPIRNVNTNSSPSKLKIIDLRIATIRKPGPSPCTIVRLDTNQGVYGLGEVRDLASPTYALFLKSRVVGENPLNITFIFEKIKQFGGDSRREFQLFDADSPVAAGVKAASRLKSNCSPTLRAPWD